MPCVLCIAGPTASGKSGFAINVAKAVGGEIINADALQIYQDLQVISARPTQEEMGDVSHHLYGHVDGAVRFSVGRWLEHAVPLIMDVMARGKVPILVGGTGLYFKALTEGLAQIPQPPEKVRLQAQELLQHQGIEALKKRASRVDPKSYAKLLGDDPQRLLRIVEVFETTGRPLSQWQERTRPIIPEGYWRGCVLSPPREQLYAKINARFDAMTQSGGWSEVSRLCVRELDPNLPVMKAIGVPQLAKGLSGEMSRLQAIELAKRDTRRFAKRQMTWFRGQAQNWPKLETEAQRNEWLNTCLDIAV